VQMFACGNYWKDPTGPPPGIWEDRNAWAVIRANIDPGLSSRASIMPKGISLEPPTINLRRTHIVLPKGTWCTGGAEVRAEVHPKTDTNVPMNWLVRKVSSASQ
jgi:hypothetical protein